MSVRTTLERFIAVCRDKHKDQYDYSHLTFFRSMQDHLEIGCRVHGKFKIQALKHYYRGQGCKLCDDGRKGDRLRGRLHLTAATNFQRHKESFLERAKAVHGDTYDYSQTVYRGARKKVVIICPRHGSFEQFATKHLMGRGCWDCGQKSAAEKEVWEFVSSLTKTAVRRDRQTIAPKELDIVVPDRKLAIEYCGHYWHSTLGISPEAARKKHVVKYKAAAAKGIRLLTIFEDEWRERRPQIEAMLDRVINPQRGPGARECVVTGGGDFSAFYEKYHIQGAPQWGEHLGLSHKGELVAVMSFGKGSARRGHQDWELSRFATAQNIAGAASKLFKALIAKTGAEKVWSFSDNRYFGGEMYGRLGFQLDEELKPDYSVVKGGERRHKSSMARSSIPARIKEVGSDELFDPATDPRSEQEMTKLLGFGRIYDCGKKRWLWTKSAGAKTG